jgi:hypothetical protein
MVLLYDSQTHTFWMCDTDLAGIGDLRWCQCNAVTEDNCLLFFGPWHERWAAPS